ncbi:MAG: ECF transporter S component [Erysipelotrichia bacterium]|jgi:uncharacterized membrane protein|nr:ECF transporter S component [Erysipelotrichia bacterium]
MKTKQIAYNALIIALIAVMAFVPWLGFITIGTVSITILHVPVIIAALLLGGQSAIIASLAFGVSTMLVAMTRGVTPIDLLFVNPVVSVLPRLMFGLVLAGLVKLFNKDRFADTLTDLMVAIVGTLAHTLFVLTILFMFLGYEGTLLTQISIWWTLVLGILLTNTSLEILASVFIAIPVVKVLRRRLR